MIVSVFAAAIASTGLLMVVAIVASCLYLDSRKYIPYKKKIDEVKREIQVGQLTVSNLEDEIKKLEADKLAVQEIIKKKEAMEDFINNYQKEYDDKQKSIAYLQEQYEEVFKKLKNVADELELAQKHVSEAEKEAQSIESQCMAREAQIEALDTSIRNKTKEINDLEDKIKVLEEQKSNLNVEVEKLKREKAGLEKDIERVKADKAKADSDLRTAQLELKDVTKQHSALSLELAGLAGKADAVSNRWEDLDRKVMPVKGRPKAFFNEEEELLKFEKRLQESQIVFSDRTIKAFHTSLKVGDSSPLVVLAGISGTGKSLLPQLYAQAFGMNFLSVAVQPRWDSPQDMFGFYNYMQNKYKATELSRLLWQFDIFNNSKAKEEFDNNEGLLPMSLVLLDEMNLARVEYYFSDMLSKLEIRRTVDKRMDGSRETAEIEIEGGSIGSDNLSRRLFVNSNTLFLGTMNEDETTQSLSDKVMDRANVLRFGKPENINVKMDKSKFDSAYPMDSDRYMSLSNWRSMLNNGQLSKASISKLDTVVGKLNNALAGIDRPFAYRVRGTIFDYVTQYPGAAKDAQSFQNALADQVEMKILPKLNGVDMASTAVSKALKDISGILADDVKDKELSEAFDKLASNRDGNAFFQWKGVVR